MKMKIKSIEKKVAEKVARCKAKVAEKCGKTGAAKKVAAVAVAFALSCLAGCHMGEVPIAQRAQTATTDVRFIIEDGGKANFTFGAEFVSLAQANETSGTENMTNTPSNIPTVDIKPDTDVSIPVIP